MDNQNMDSENMQDNMLNTNNNNNNNNNVGANPVGEMFNNGNNIPVESVQNVQEPLQQVPPVQSTTNVNIVNQPPLEPTDVKSNNRKNPKLLLPIIVVIIVVILGIIFVPKLFNSKSVSIPGGSSITKSDIEKYNIELSTIWINEPLDITYNLPKIDETYYSNTGDRSLPYLHGECTAYNSGWKICLEKSLDGHTNLETLFSDIMAEKISDKYALIYKDKRFEQDIYDYSEFFTTSSNFKTKKMKINGMDVIYFES